MNIKRFPFLKFLAPLTLGLGGAILLPSYSAIAAPSLTITPITWNVVGLDSVANQMLGGAGPDQFMAGARVCNVGDATATNVTAKFVKDGGSSYINLVGKNILSVPSLPAGRTSHPPGNTGSTPSNCYDFYFNLALTRSSAAYSDLKFPSTRQQFHIEATATGLTTVSTTAGRELYVEKLVSQNRNAVDSITGPSTVYVGQTVQYTVNSHTAPGGYEQLSVLPLLPVFFQLISASSTYSAPSGSTNNTVYADACGWVNDPTSPDYHNNGACNLPDNYTGGKAGDKITTVYTIKVLSTGSGSLSNIIYDYSGSSYHYNDDLGRGQNIFAVTALPPQADLSIAKTDNQTTANPGKPISYTITVTNSGPSDVTGATVTDTVPSTITGVSWSCTASSGSSCGAASGTGNTINTTANLLSGGTATYTVTGTVSPTASGTLSNTASVAAPTGVTDPNTGNNSSTDTDTIAPTPDLTITKSHTGNFNQSATGIYTITATNSGTASTSGLVTVTDTLPTGLTFGTASGTGWTCNISGQTVTCTRTDALAASNSYPAIDLSVNVASNAPSSVTNTASVSGGGEVNTTNNSAPDPTTIDSPSADLGITKTDGQTTATPGNSIAYTIAVTNNGPSTVNSVTVTDAVPAAILNPTFTASTGTYNSSTGAWTGLNLASGQSITLTMRGTISPTATGNLTNTATVAAPTGVTDSNTSNNSSTDTDTLTPTADLSITKTDAKTSITPGSATSYTITVTNNGPSTVNSVTVTDAVPSTIQNPIFTASTGSYNSSTGAWTGLNLASGQSVTLTLSGTVSSTATGTISNTATVAAPSGVTDPTSSNNSSTDTTTVTATADLSLTKTASSTNPKVGQNATFTVTVRNAGPSTATGVVVTDLLPAGLSFVSATPSQGTYNNSTGIWTVGGITSGANATLQVTATLTSNNVVTNTAEVTASDQPDPNSTPNNHVATEDDQASVTVGSSISKLLLVKRITAIIPANGINTTSFVDDPNTTDDNSPDWSTGYLKGAINGGAAKPGDEVEYTIYFLSDGGRATQKVNMCDLIPANTTFSTDAFGSGLGIQRATGSATSVNLTNTGTDSDGGQFVAAGGSIPTGVSCGASNTNGAVIVNLGDLPNATSAGSPSNSYGFIRFRVKVK